MKDADSVSVTLLRERGRALKRRSHSLLRTRQKGLLQINVCLQYWSQSANTLELWCTWKYEVQRMRRISKSISQSFHVCALLSTKSVRIMRGLPQFAESLQRISVKLVDSLIGRRVHKNGKKESTPTKSALNNASSQIGPLASAITTYPNQ